MPTLPMSPNPTEPMRLERPGHLSGCETGLDPGCLACDINIDVVRRAEVDEQTVARAVSCGVVRSTADEQRHTRMPSRIDHYCYVIGMLGSYHRHRLADPDRKVWGACLVVLSIICGQYLAIRV
jgi:hypothetical protein